jgi:hypothetical protein
MERLHIALAACATKSPATPQPLQPGRYWNGAKMFGTYAMCFVLACFAAFLAYEAGQSHGSKMLKNRVLKALEQHEIDVSHGYSEGYSGLGLARIIRNIIS